MGFLKDQTYVSKQTPMPIDDVGSSQSIVSVTGETVALYYNNGGTRTTDAGQAAGTAVTGQLAFKNILDAGGGAIATSGDTSLAFTGDCFTTQVSFPTAYYEDVKDGTWLAKLTAVTGNLSNGQYCVDYGNGTIYGKKATTTSSLTSTSYKINQAQTGGSPVLPSNINISQIGGVATIADDGAFTVGTSTGIVVMGLADEMATDSVSEGDVGALRMTLDRRLITADMVLDDAAFGVATGYVSVAGFLADEAATDSVAEGDVGAGRMTLDRRQIMASQTLDDAAFGVGTEYVTAVGFLADEASTDSVTEGDIGAARMTLDRRQIMAGMTLDDAAFGIGTEYVQAIGMLADEASTDSVTEGDIGLPRMTLTRKAIGASDYLEDSAHTDGDYGTQILGVRKDTLAALAGTTGDYAPLEIDANGALYARIVTSAGASVDTFGLSMVDDTAFTPATSSVTPIGAMADETTPDSVDEGDVGALRMTLTRFLKTSQGDLISGEDQSNNLLAIIQKPVAVNTYALSTDLSAALEASTVTKASAGNVYKAMGRLDSTYATATYYIQLLNAASLPADGAVTHLRAPIKIQHTSGTDDYWDFCIAENFPVYASTGIVMCVSTTEFTKTIGGAYTSSSISYL